MTASHLLNLVVFSALVSSVFAMLQRDDKKGRLRYGLQAFGAFLLSALVIGWLMYPFPTQVEPSTLAWRRAVPWGPVVAWTALIFLLSSQPRVPRLGGVPDVVTHGVGYLVLCFLITRAVSLGWPLGGWPGPLAVVLSTLYGVSDELHQAFVPGRHADVWDVVKDALGAVLGALAYRRFAGRQHADGRSR